MSWARAVPAARAVFTVFGLGAALRLLTLVLYSDPVLNYYGGDAARYARLPSTPYHALFSDPAIPAGYPAFLRVVRAISNDVVLTVGLQHLIGIATAVLLMLAVRRTGISPHLALVPAAVILLSGDHLFLEQALLTETLWLFFICAGVYAALSAHSDRGERWLVATGISLALAALVRHVALPLALIAGVWAAIVFPGTLLRRLRAGAMVLVPAGLVLAAYVGAVSLKGGYVGFTDQSGFNLYGRVGQFADCSRFTPPAGTASLCERTPQSVRHGPYFYTFNPRSPAYRHVRFEPHYSAILDRFARQAILHQPLDYLQAVFDDMVRYLAPEAARLRPESGTDPQDMSFADTAHPQQGATPQQFARSLEQVYSDVSPGLPGRTVRTLLGSYQSVFRVNGLVILVFLALALIGLARARSPLRAAIALLLVIACYLYAAPPALNSYDVRYGVPPGPLLVAAGIIGLAALLDRRRPGGALSRVPSRGP